MRPPEPLRDVARELADLDRVIGLRGQAFRDLKIAQWHHEDRAVDEATATIRRINDFLKRGR